ncbi:hypothetical protein [Sulfitobacter sp. PS-8MA]|uniref:hypothetical protein n=1 Tax=Sulfitobacter sp. PS-8MA TaxID=3237707 RepID=UPI0034C5CD63
MIDFIFAVIAIGIAGQGAPSDGITAPLSPDVPRRAQAPASPAAPAPPAAPASPDLGASFDMSALPAGLAAEDQTPRGQFTTAGEVRPILSATRRSWIALRAYDGRDYLYVTHLWNWRCGLAAIAVSVNDGPMVNWTMPPCHTESATPNAILEGDPLPYVTFGLGSVQSVRVQLVYDDLSMESARFARGAVLIP